MQYEFCFTITAACNLRYDFLLSINLSYAFLYNLASITVICSVNFGHSLAMSLSHISFSLHRRHCNQKDLIERDPLNDDVQLIIEPRETNQCFTARNIFIHRKENV